ncbi:hypothetical protein AGMMS50268_01460 [Spirochaetia bacterium]|nr:hypothetical protein AGMMS50268_01460 [Spirochaetia bacterium]
MEIKQYFLQDKFIKLFKYLLVGGTVFCIQTTLLWLFKRKLTMENKMAVTIAYISATAIHFLLNNFFTFLGSVVEYKRRIIGYLFTAGCNFIIAFLVSNLLFKYVIDNVLIVNIISVSSTTLFGFLVLSKIVYKIL